jgi:hypothetical protein
MFRKTVLAIAATAVIGAASLTPASAHGWHHGVGFGALGFGLGVLGAAAIANSYAVEPSSCWQPQYILTRYGYYKRVLVNVCE